MNVTKLPTYRYTTDYSAVPECYPIYLAFVPNVSIKDYFCKRSPLTRMCAEKVVLNKIALMACFIMIFMYIKLDLFLAFPSSVKKTNVQMVSIRLDK